MIIKYCPTCPNNPYTKDKKKKICPICGSELLMEAVQPDELNHRPKLGESHFENDFDDSSSNMVDKDYSFDSNNFNKNEEVKGTKLNMSSEGKQRQLHKNCIVGRVLEYSNTDQEGSRYHRNFFEKIFQSIIYGQKTDDILHRFTIRENNGEDNTGFLMTRDITVNIHGIVTDGANIHENSEIRATGKYKGSVFYAKKLEVMDGSYGREVNFQRSSSTMVFAVIAAIIGLFLLGTIISSIVGGNGSQLAIFGQKRYWILTLILFVVLVSVILGKFSHFGMMMMFSGKKVNILPALLVLFVISMVLSYLLYGFIWGGGIFNLFGSVLGLLMPIIIVIFGIYILFKIIF